MKLWNSREELLAQVLSLTQQGVSARAAARALGVSRNTVRKLVAAHHRARDAVPVSALPAPPPRAPRTTKLDACRAQFDELLQRYPDITAQRLFEDLRAAGYTGGHTAVKELVRRVRPAPGPTPSCTAPVYGPAEMAERDWSPYTLAFTHAPPAMVQLFAYTLTYSTRKHFAIFERCDLYALMDGHTATFDRFGGAAHECKYDGQKAVVLGREGRQPIYNPRFLAFCAHYEFRPVACRPYHPNDKPRAERANWEFERSFLNGRSFRDLADMRQQLQTWEDQIADLRVRRHAPKRPRPRHPYDTARVAYRHCSIDGFVDWAGNRYAVPYEHITDLLPVRITQHELLVYAADLTCVARHELALRSQGLAVGVDCYHPRRTDRRGAADLDQLRATYADLGEDAAAYFAALCTAQPRLAGYQARRVLLLRERYCTTDLAAALRHARAYGALEHQAVERILAARATPRRLAEYVAEDLPRRLALNLGGPGTEPRDLTEYDQLPVGPGTGPTQEAPCPDDPSPPTSSSTGSDAPSRSSG